MIDYRTVNPTDVPALLRLWLNCFDEQEKAAKLFFERNLSYTHAYLAADGATVVAAVYLISCTLCGKPAHYLCGAATKPSHRGRGVMSSLIEYALKDAARRGDCYSVLLPANDGLYRFYARLGYQPCCTSAALKLESIPGKPVPGAPDLHQLQRCNEDKFLLWNNNFISFAREYYACYGAKSAESKNAFALFEQNGDSADVFYAIYNDIKELKMLMNQHGVRRFTLTGSAQNPLFRDCAAQTRGMLRPLCGSVVLDNVYIGITLS